MRRIGVWIIVLAISGLAIGCSQNAEKESSGAPSVQETEMKEIQEPQEETEEEIKESPEFQEESYEDNFAVDSEASAEFAEKIKTAVAEKNLEALADLTSFPVYVGFQEGGTPVNNREEFLALGADKIFTRELAESVAAADVNSLSPSMAGFVLSDGSKANIIFAVNEGKLTIVGINY